MTVTLAAEALPADTPAPERYDFRRPVALAREQARRLDESFDTFARQWATQLAARLGAIVEIEAHPVAVLRYSQIVEAFRDDDALVRCVLPGVTPRAVIQISVPATLGWIARMVGGVGRAVFETRAFTPIEKALVRRILDDAIDRLQYALDGVIPLDLGVESIHATPQLAQAAAAGEEMIGVRFSIRVDDAVTSVTLAVPTSAVLPYFTPPPHPALGAPKTPVELLRGQIAASPVELALTFRTAPVSPATILGLAVGDVFTLPHGQHLPLDLALDGQVVAHAAIGTQGKRLACVVVDLEETE